MAKISIQLDKYCEIEIPTLDTDSVLKLPIEKIQEFVKYLEMDEIVDIMDENNQINQLIDRLCYDYPEKISNLFVQFIEKSKHQINSNELDDNLINYLKDL